MRFAGRSNPPKLSPVDGSEPMPEYGLGVVSLCKSSVGNSQFSTYFLR